LRDAPYTTPNFLCAGVGFHYLFLLKWFEYDMQWEANRPVTEISDNVLIWEGMALSRRSFDLCYFVIPKFMELLQYQFCWIWV